MKRPARILLILSLACLLALAGLEAGLRLTTDYKPQPAYVLRPGLGFVFDPASAPDRVNAMGFIDRERDPAGQAGERVLLLGDSFVSGTSLAARLEERLAKDLGKPVEVIPMGFPGIGLGGMLGFYETFGRAFAPKAVVAVFNSSTFANDSPLLTAIKMRLDPDRPCSLFVTAGPDGTCRRLEADPACLQDLPSDLDVHRRPSLGSRLDAALDRVLGWSYAYGWLKDTVSRDDPEAYRAEDHQYAHRLARLRCRPELARAFAGWAFPDDLDVNMMFWTPEANMPPAFGQALADTGCLLETLARQARDQGALFLLAVSDDCTRPTPGMRREFELRARHVKRPFEEAGCLKKIAALAESRGIPLVDLAPDLAAVTATGHPDNDIHWTDAGNDAAAVGIAKALTAQGFGRSYEGP